MTFQLLWKNWKIELAEPRTDRAAVNVTALTSAHATVALN